jgi:predicted metal-dependent hydrolase
VGLLEQPRDAIEYVLWHELCHLTHFDHSKAFYALLASQMPDWQARKQRLEI